jgi:hypothetical protein
MIGASFGTCHTGHADRIGLISLLHFHESNHDFSQHICLLTVPRMEWITSLAPIAEPESNI